MSDPLGSPSSVGWSEQDSSIFIDLGHYFVPEREEQVRIICDLIPPIADAHHVVDLCGGEGLLSLALLERHPQRRVHIFDGSRAMLARAARLLKQHEDRVDVQIFDLAATDWRKFPWPIHAAVSSLGIHHLDDRQKQRLFLDIANMLAPGGVFIIADVIRPTTELGAAVAARLWDQAVQKRALMFDGDLQAFG